MGRDKIHVEAIKQHQEEQKLFQFLNGLDHGYGALRSQLILMRTLPTVETATSMVQQDESQSEVFGKRKSVRIALYSKNDDNAQVNADNSKLVTARAHNAVGINRENQAQFSNQEHIDLQAMNP